METGIKKINFIEKFKSLDVEDTRLKFLEIEELVEQASTKEEMEDLLRQLRAIEELAINKQVTISTHKLIELKNLLKKKLAH